MARAEHGHQVSARAMGALLEAAGERVELPDRPLQVLLLDLVVGGRRVFHPRGPTLTDPVPLLPAHQRLPRRRPPRTGFGGLWARARRTGAGLAVVCRNLR